MLSEIMLFLEGFFTHFFDVAIKQKSIIYVNTYYFLCFIINLGISIKLTNFYFQFTCLNRIEAFIRI